MRDFDESSLFLKKPIENNEHYDLEISKGIITWHS